MEAELVMNVGVTLHFFKQKYFLFHAESFFSLENKYKFLNFLRNFFLLLGKIPSINQIIYGHS